MQRVLISPATFYKCFSALAAEHITEADVFGYISSLRRQLVIFGFVEGPGFAWRGFVYEDGQFVKLTVSQAEAASA